MKLSAAFRVAAVAVCLTGCGYHVAGNTIPAPSADGKTGAVPANIKSIAVPAFSTTIPRPKLTRLLATNITQELISRTKYNIIADPAQGDAVLTGSLANFAIFQTISDPTTGRATGAEIIVTVQVKLTDRVTGKVLFNMPSHEFRERYEISTDPQTYFDESGTAVERVARDVARSIVSAILENF